MTLVSTHAERRLRQLEAQQMVQRLMRKPQLTAEDAIGVDGRLLSEMNVMEQEIRAGGRL